MELGVYTFGNTPRTADGGYGPSVADHVTHPQQTGRHTHWNQRCERAARTADSNAYVYLSAEDV
jgi:hypothetical protein